VFVVPVSQQADGTHLHSLVDALPAAGPSGVVTIEPGASPDLIQPVTVTQEFITIQGDLNVPPTALPSYQLVIHAGNVKLTNLVLSSVEVGTSGPLKSAFNNVSKCVITTLTAFDASLDLLAETSSTAAPASPGTARRAAM